MPQKIIHIELIVPYKGEIHWYFGSKSAVYDIFTSEQIGIKKESLWNVNLEDIPYKNKFCTIRLGRLRRKSTLRGIKPNQL